MTAIVENEHGSANRVDHGATGRLKDRPHVLHQGDNDMPTDRKSVV